LGRYNHEKYQHFHDIRQTLIEVDLISTNSLGAAQGFNSADSDTTGACVVISLLTVKHHLFEIDTTDDFATRDILSRAAPYHVRRVRSGNRITEGDNIEYQQALKYMNENNILRQGSYTMIDAHGNIFSQEIFKLLNPLNEAEENVGVGK